jgi:hypothetical protein
VASGEMQPETELKLRTKIVVCITAAVAVAGASVRGGCHNSGAHIGVDDLGRANVVSFLNGQFTSARAYEHPVIFML